MGELKWRKAAGNYGPLSGILAGFCIVFISFFLSFIHTEGESKLMSEFVVIFFTGAAFLFILAAERYFMSISYDDAKKFDLGSDFYNLGIIFMLTGLLLMFITFKLVWASVVAGIILAIEIYLVKKVY